MIAGSVFEGQSVSSSMVKSAWDSKIERHAFFCTPKRATGEIKKVEEIAQGG